MFQCTIRPVCPAHAPVAPVGTIQRSPLAGEPGGVVSVRLLTLPCTSASRRISASLPALHGLDIDARTGQPNPTASPKQRIIGRIMTAVEKVRVDSETNLRDILDRVHEISIDNIDDTHFFTLSQVYEDLLLKMGEKNSDGGQFFTPREVIRAMVHTVDPQLGQTVYDPCCGTGGFLAIAYEHISRRLGRSPLSTDLETLKHDTFFGREKENLVIPIALANLVLHGIDQPNLWHGNSLTRRAKGALGTVEGKRVALGSAAFLAEHGVDAAALAAQAERLREDGATVIFAGVDGSLSAAFAIADPVKATTPDAIAALKREGVRIVMLTGDNRTTARAVAARLGINEVEAEVLPDQKSAIVERLRREGRIVAMAGDGVNDAPALAAADVGIAMGTGTDVAMESAGVTLLRGDLMGIVKARRLSHATMRNIRQNLFFAFAYNAAGVPVAAGVLYPAFGLLLSPIIAAAAMALSSVSVVGNAPRLRSFKP